MRGIGGIIGGALALGLAFGSCDAASAAKRALVIGNQDYAYLPDLQKAIGDAEEMKAALERLGFEVVIARNVDDEVVVHYSGHGVAINGRNFLAPVDLQEPRPGQERRVAQFAYDAAQMVEEIRLKQPKFVFAILDACRDNPFQGVGRAVGLTRGLARMEAEPGQFILFSAGPGETALDRLSNDDPVRTSVFTRALLQHLERGGLTLQAIARATQTQVFAAAGRIGHRQFPDYSDRTIRDFMLAPETPRAQSQQAEADTLCRMAKLDGSEAALRAYVMRFPGQACAAEIVTMLERRAEAAARAAAVAPPPAPSPATPPTPSLAFTPAPSPSPPVRDMALMRTLEGHAGSVLSIAFSADGRTLASGSDDNTVKLWDVGTGRLIRSIDAQEGLVQSIAFSADGRMLASGSYGDMVKLWDAGTGRLIRSINAHVGEVPSIAFSPDGRTLASGGVDKTVRLWDTGTGRRIRSINTHVNSVWSVAFSPDGRTLASGSADKTVKLWDVGTGRLIRSINAHEHWVWSVAFSPDGRALATGGGDNTVKLWDVGTGRLIRLIGANAGATRSVAFSPDGRTLASGSYDKTVKLWNVGTGQLIQSIDAHADWVRSVSFSLDGRILASGGDDKIIKLWSSPGQASAGGR